MGSAAGAVAETVDALVAPGRAGRPGHRAAVPAVPGRGARAGPAAVVHPHRRARPHQGAGRRRRAALPRRAAPPSTRPWRTTSRRSRWRPASIGGRYGLSSKEFTPSMVAAVFDELAGRPAHAGTSPSASSTTSPTSAWRRVDIDVARSPRRGAGDVLRPRLRRHGRRQQELGEDHRRAHRPLRPGLLRLRLQEVGLGHRVAPPLRPRADPLDLPHRRRRLRGLPPVRAAREDEGARARPPRRDVPAQQPVRRPTRCGTTCRSRCRTQIIDQGHRPLGHRRRGQSPATPAWATASTP